MTDLVAMAEARLGRGNIPAGFEPGLELDPTTLTGQVSMSVPEGTAPDVAAFVRERCADMPEQVDVESLVFTPTNFRVWEQKPDVWVRYWRFSITPALPSRDMGDLLKRVRKRRPTARPQPGSHVYIVNLSDMHIGKSDPDQLVDDLSLKLAQVRADIRTHRKLGTDIGAVAFANVGDPIENVGGHYPMQEFQATLNLRQQMMVAREVLDQWITDLSGLVPKLWCVAVDSNHAQIRKDGKAFTSFDDTIDRLLFDELAFAYQGNPERYGHVELVAPPLDDLTVALEIAGTKIGWAHGHQVNGSAHDAVWKWWEKQALARTPVGGCDLLITGHKHHLASRMEGTFDGRPRMWCQCPSFDYDSTWFRHGSGAYTVNGVLTLVVKDGRVSWMRVV